MQFSRLSRRFVGGEKRKSFLLHLDAVLLFVIQKWINLGSLSLFSLSSCNQTEELNSARLVQKGKVKLVEWS